MTLKIKFLNPVSKNKFLHHLVNAKKTNGNYRHSYHKVLEELPEKASFRIFDEENKSLVDCDIDFYPNENLVDIEFQDCDIEKFRSLFVFGLLESLDEKAFVRCVGMNFFYNSGMEFFVMRGGKKSVTYKLSSDRDNLLEVEAYRIPMEIRNQSDIVF